MHFFFSGLPLMECCRVNDKLPENTTFGLPPGWVDTNYYYYSSYYYRWVWFRWHCCTAAAGPTYNVNI